MYHDPSLHFVRVLVCVYACLCVRFCYGGCFHSISFLPEHMHCFQNEYSNIKLSIQ